MRHSHHLITTSEALQRVFLPSFQPTAIFSFRSTGKCPHHLQQSYYSTHRSKLPLIQPLHVRPSSTAHTAAHLASLSQSNLPRQNLDRHPRDEEIKASKVCIVGSDKRLSDPIPTYDALQLRQRDEKGRLLQYLQEVASANEEKGRYYPTCKLFDSKVVRETKEARRKSSKEDKVQRKQLEVSWHATDNDLSHRLRKLKEFLEKGWRVDLIFGRRGRHREASQDNINRVSNRIKEVVKEVDGARETKALKGIEGGPATLSYEGKAKK